MQGDKPVAALLCKRLAASCCSLGPAGDNRVATAHRQLRTPKLNICVTRQGCHTSSNEYLLMNFGQDPTL